MFVRRTLAALAIGTVLVGATAAQASAGAERTTSADRALHVRSEALNNLNRNAVTGLSPDAFNALAVRSEGLNRYARTLQASTSAASASASTSFAWDEFGIGMAAGLGLVLLAGGLAVAVRSGTRRRVSIPS